jgi:MoxR-like ATPase
VRYIMRLPWVATASDGSVFYERATRTSDEIQLGASPRAALALHRGAQALAAMRGRDFVKPDDIKELAAPTLAHRLILHPEARLRGRSPADIVRALVSRVAAPVE